jgi:hypothetical protein
MYDLVSSISLPLHYLECKDNFFSILPGATLCVTADVSAWCWVWALPCAALCVTANVSAWSWVWALPCAALCVTANVSAWSWVGLFLVLHCA